jgi:hypothetical protein
LESGITHPAIVGCSQFANCDIASGFPEFVCLSELGTAAFNLTDKELAPLNADALIDRIAAGEDQWIKIGKGSDDGASAADFADQGYLVVALLKAQDHQPKNEAASARGRGAPCPASR